MGLEGKVALVTGGTRGIGKAIRLTLEEEGCRVDGIGRADRDLSVRKNRELVFRHTISLYGRMDILINNAGEQCFHPAVDYPAEDWEHTISLMLTAPFELSVQAARWMLNHDGGHIINILSTSAFQGSRNNAAYVAAKHGLLGLTRALAIEWAPSVHVNAVAPGFVETDMTAAFPPNRKQLLESITPAGRYVTAEEVADAVVFLARSTGIYGQVVTVDAGWLVKNG